MGIRTVRSRQNAKDRGNMICFFIVAGVIGLLLLVIVIIPNLRKNDNNNYKHDFTTKTKDSFDDPWFEEAGRRLEDRVSGKTNPFDDPWFKEAAKTNREMLNKMGKTNPFDDP